MRTLWLSWLNDKYSYKQNVLSSSSFLGLAYLHYDECYIITSKVHLCPHLHASGEYKLISNSSCLTTCPPLFYLNLTLFLYSQCGPAASPAPANTPRTARPVPLPTLSGACFCRYSDRSAREATKPTMLKYRLHLPHWHKLWQLHQPFKIIISPFSFNSERAFKLILSILAALTFCWFDRADSMINIDVDKMTYHHHF